MSERIGILALGILLAAGVPADGAPAAVPAVHTVRIAAMRFEPPVLDLQRGERVVWVNENPFPHRVTAPGFDSGAIAPAASWTWVATEPGRHAYVCGYHPTMKGEVHIR
jgi:plastocyanin